MKNPDVKNTAAIAAMRSWAPRRWIVAGMSAIAFTVVVAIPTDLIDTPFFSREIPPTWWAWPALIVSSILTGLLIATYVAPSTPHQGEPETSDKSRVGGYVGSILTFFAVGCPVCNKLVLVALGSAGALTWFQPIQPFLQMAAVGLLVWALLYRLRGEIECPLPQQNIAAQQSGAQIND